MKTSHRPFSALISLFLLITTLTSLGDDGALRQKVERAIEKLQAQTNCTIRSEQISKFEDKQRGYDQFVTTESKISRDTGYVRVSWQETVVIDPKFHPEGPLTQKYQAVTKDGRSVEKTGRGEWKIVKTAAINSPMGMTRQEMQMAKGFSETNGVISYEWDKASVARLAIRKFIGGPGPKLVESKGSTSYWFKDGMVEKTETVLFFKWTFGGSENTELRTITTTYKDIGTTKVVVPQEALDLLQQQPAKSSNK